MRFGVGFGVRIGALLALAGTSSAAAQAPYRFIVGAESEDQVALVEFVPCTPARGAGGAGAGAGADGTRGECGARVVRTYDVGVWVSDMEGPHGVIPAHDGQSFYVSIAHGRPRGFLRRFDIETGRMLGEAELGMFPASVDIAPGSSVVYVVNFNFEDPEMLPSSVSVVEGNTMTEIARPITCSMPHGSRLNPQGTRHYSGCMMNDLLVEIDTRSFEVVRMLRVTPGDEAAVSPGEADRAHHRTDGATHNAHAGGGHAAARPGKGAVQVTPAGVRPAGAPHDAASDAGFFPMKSDCSPTWVQPSHDGDRVYITCNRSAEIVEVDVARWAVSRRWKTPPAPYNAAVTPDGRLLIVTQKGPGTTTIWRLSDARLLAEVPGTRKVASGVVASADSRYAFVTLEGIGSDPGTIDIIDLGTNQKVASVDVGKQAGGIAMMP